MHYLCCVEVFKSLTLAECGCFGCCHRIFTQACISDFIYTSYANVYFSYWLVGFICFLSLSSSNVILLFWCRCKYTKMKDGEEEDLWVLGLMGLLYFLRPNPSSSIRVPPSPPKALNIYVQLPCKASSRSVFTMHL